MKYEPPHDSNRQNGMCILPVWLESWLSAWRKLGSLATHWAKTDQTGRKPGWYESLLSAQSFCWFCHEAAHISKANWSLTKQPFPFFGSPIDRQCILCISKMVRSKKGILQKYSEPTKFENSDSVWLSLFMRDTEKVIKFRALKNLL